MEREFDGRTLTRRRSCLNGNGSDGIRRRVFLFADDLTMLFNVNPVRVSQRFNHDVCQEAFI